MKRSWMFLVVVTFMLMSAGSAWGGAVPHDPQGQVEAYKVGVADVLDIRVIKPMAIESTVTVAPDGAITFPYIGNVLVEGVTLPEIQDEIQRRLADGYMEYPVVSVSLKLSRSKKYIIYGEVMRPGAYPVEEDMTLLHAISVAGGFSVPGATGSVKLLRPESENGEGEIVESDPQVVVRPGDTIVVKVDKYYIYGQVARPGAYPVEEDMTLLHAVTLAGGFVQSAATGKVKLVRAGSSGGGPETIELDVAAVLSGEARNVPVLAGDTVVVSADRFFVSGEVLRPGAYPVEEQMTLLHAINVAGGFTESNATGRVKLLRPKVYDPFSAQEPESVPETDEGESNEFETVLDLSIKEVVSGGYRSAQVLPGDAIVVFVDTFFVSGKVVRPGEYPLEENMTLLQAITLAGGFVESDSIGMVKLLRPSGDSSESEVIVSDVTSILNGVYQDVGILPGDTIVVSSDKFYVYGEVARPGIYPLQTSTSTLTAISMAGGFTKFGGARVKVLRMNGQSGKYDTMHVNIKDVISGNSTGDILIEHGDVVVVSEGVF
ncbi:MAG: SLBB domain-containing protein [Candidatus Omnitrophica bacterium]|nr:SLBB domain-containing protein [Candidatus Omnitrophota bacterium]